MKIRRLLVTTFIALIIPIRVLGEELVVYNSTVEAENNNYTQKIYKETN